MDYYFAGKAICNRCGKEYSWYCVNLTLKKRGRGEPTFYSEPKGAHMGYSGYCKDGIPEYQGYCYECNQVATLPDDVATTIPREYYMSL